MKLAAFVFGFIVLVGFFLVGKALFVSDTLDTDLNRRFDEQLPELPANRWVKLRVPFAGGWSRQRHAGAVFDTRRNKLFVFGSDTRGENWDNTIHEFDPLILRWSQHYTPARRRTYRLDRRGRPVAGDEQPQPWAMQVNDSLVYDPKSDALYLLSQPEHNPAARVAGNIRQHPIWIYDLGRRQWRMMEQVKGEMPSAPGGASAYDSDRDVIVVYNRQGVWELGPERRHWLLATKETHHERDQRMVYDSLHHKLLVFGGEGGGKTVWSYTPGTVPGAKGVWQEMVPGGDECPQDEHITAAFDSNNGVVVLVVDNPPPAGKGKPVSSSTFVYDPGSNVYFKLGQADLPPVGMNYMMGYDPTNRLFYLVGEGRSGLPVVWALDLELLPGDNRPVPAV